MGVVKKIRFIGKHDNLVSGQFYTYTDYAKVANVGYKCMVSRICYKSFVTESDLVPVSINKKTFQYRNTKNTEQSRLESHSQIMMDKYLRRPL